MLDDLGISVNVKIPREIKQAAAEMPEFSQVVDRMRATMDASNVTALTMTAAGIMGAIIVVLLLVEKGR